LVALREKRQGNHPFPEVDHDKRTGDLAPTNSARTHPMAGLELMVHRKISVGCHGRAQAFGAAQWWCWDATIRDHRDPLRPQGTRAFTTGTSAVDPSTA